MKPSHFFKLSFALGAAAVVWVGAGFAGTHHLALLMTGFIGALYLYGAWELHLFRQATQDLQEALAAIPASLAHLDDWLPKVPTGLQNAVRLRIEGERVGLPGPALTPYLLGLLVMLGMLGTFLGMVVTLNGAVFALDATSDLQAMRAAFATPIKGLGLAFGTSVAGVASSAMLGLMSALSRRERQQAAQQLEARIASDLRPFSLVHQRQATFAALQQQSAMLPTVLERLQSLMSHMEQAGQRLGQQLSANQAQFHLETQTAYRQLASSVSEALQAHLRQSLQQASEGMRPVVEHAMQGLTNAHGELAQQLQQSHSALQATFGQQASNLLKEVRDSYADLQVRQAAQEALQRQGWTQGLTDLSTQLKQHWQDAATQTLDGIQHLLSASEALVQARVDNESAWAAQQDDRLAQLTHTLQQALRSLRDDEAQRGLAAVERLAQLETAVTQHLSTLGRTLETPVLRLVQTAAEVPQAAAEVIAQLRQEMSNSLVRDNDLLAERQHILQTLHTLLEAIRHASGEQRGVIDALVTSAGEALEQASAQFADRMTQETARLSDMAAQVNQGTASITSSAVDVASLGDALGAAVRSFHEANGQLMAHLERLEGALNQSMARSDEQLAYYVAQARELIDLSVSSQKDILDTLRQVQTP